MDMDKGALQGWARQRKHNMRIIWRAGQGRALQGREGQGRSGQGMTKKNEARQAQGQKGDWNGRSIRAGSNRRSSALCR